MTKVLFFLGRGGRIAALMVVAIAGVTCLSAAAITGGFGTTGAGVLTFTSGGVNYLDFCPTDPSSPATSPTCAEVTSSGRGVLAASGGTGTFIAVNPSSAGTILDLRSTPGPGPFTALPVGGTWAVNNFLVLSLLPSLNFQAQQFVPETCTTTSTQQCIGGFLLSQVGQNVTVSSTINGMVFDTSGVLGAAAFTDVLSGQYNNTTLLAVRDAALSTTGILSNTWSNSVSTSPVPEPATLTILGGGLLLLGSLRRRIRS
jgi:PEP-CTERM motif